MALRPLLVFVIMSGQLYPLSSDSKSDSEPDESESLKISWKKGGRGGYEIVPLSASSHQGGGGEHRKNILHHQGGLEKIFQEKIMIRIAPPTHKL